MTATTTLAVTKIDVSQASKEVTANEAFDAFDAGFGQLTKALSDANYTLSDSTVPKEWNYGILYFTGALTAGRNIIVPTNKKAYVVINGTTGGFALTVKTSGGTGIAVTGSTPRILRCDGTNVVELFTVPSTSTITPNAQTGTTYTYLNGDNAKLVTHSNASAIAGTLPQAGSGGEFTNGWFMFVQNRGVGTLTITPTTSTIDGAATLALTTGQGVLICSDGTNYFTSRGVGGSGGGGSTGPIFRAYRSGTQTVTANVFSKIQLNAEAFDPDSAFDSTTNYRFQPTTAGYYLITGGFGHTITPVDRFIAAIHKNGTRDTLGQDRISTGNNYEANVTALIYLNGSTDYVELYGFTTGTAIEGAADITYMFGSFQRA